MKQLNIIILFLLTAIYFQAQNTVVIDDFERGTKPWITLLTDIEIIDNPSKNAQNSSEKVLKCTRKANSSNWAGAILSGIYNLPVGKNGGDFGTARMKVLKTTTGNVSFKVENGPGNVAYEANSSYIPTGTWVDVSFDLKPATEGNYYSFFFMPDRTDNIDAPITVYVDDIELIRNEDQDILHEIPDNGGSGETGGYKLVWHDSFKNTALNEITGWTIEERSDGGGNNELQYYRRNNISIGSEPATGKECLIITAKKEVFAGKKATSGRLTTQYKMSFKHGKAEASIKLPKTADGLWPAFWLLGADANDNPWPACGEIDILEMGEALGISNGTQDKYFAGACHWQSDYNGLKRSASRFVTNPYSLQDDFHLYTMIWDADYIRFYLDLDKYPNATPYFTLSISGNSSLHKPDNYFQKQFFIILNLAVGGDYPQIWDINDVTALKNSDAAMYVDFVKVYQKGNPEEEFYGLKYDHSANNTPDVSSDTEWKMILNQTSGLLKVEGFDAVKADFFNLPGRLVMTQKTSNNAFDISGLPGGYYIVTFENAEKIKRTTKFIKLYN